LEGTALIKFAKQPQYAKSFLLGISAIILPTFICGQQIQRINKEILSDGRKVRNDYLKSVEGIQNEVRKFEYQR
jgi:hypothetical protein